MNTYIIFSIHKFKSIFINNYLKFYKKKIDINLIKTNIKKIFNFNNKRNIKFIFINIKKIFNKYKYNNIYYKKLTIFFSKKIIFDKLNIIEGINLSHNINISNILINLDLIKITNSRILIEIPIYYNNKNYFNEFENLFFNINNFLNRLKLNNLEGLIIIHFSFIKSQFNFIKEKIEKIKLKYKLKTINNIFIKPILILDYLHKILNLLNINHIFYKNIKNLFINELVIIDNFNFINFDYFAKNNKYIMLANIYNLNDMYLYLNKIKNYNNFVIIFNFKYINNKNKYLNKFILKNNILYTTKNILKILKILELYIIKKNNYSIINVERNNIFLFKDIKLKNKFYSNYLSVDMFKQYILDIAISKKNKKILFYEYNDIRILKAISFCQLNNISECYLLGNPDEIYKNAKFNNININNINILNDNDIRFNYIDKLIKIRKNKNISYKDAKLLLNDNMVLSSLILNDNLVNGIVAGSLSTTSSILKPAIQIIKVSNNNTIISSLFLMLLESNIIIYADCAVNINPNYNQLSEIVIQTYNFANKINFLPKIALLSYSTYDSSKGESVDKINLAKEKILSINSNIIIDGPIQYDAASSFEVNLLKSKNSILKGKSNIYIFPNLDSGNITYKAVQRTNNIISIGPIIQGLNKPVNDLSRGCSIEDIIYTIAITVIQNDLD